MVDGAANAGAGGMRSGMRHGKGSHSGAMAILRSKSWNVKLTWKSPKYDKMKVRLKFLLELAVALLMKWNKGAGFHAAVAVICAAVDAAFVDIHRRC